MWVPDRLLLQYSLGQSVVLPWEDIFTCAHPAGPCSINEGYSVNMDCTYLQNTSDKYVLVSSNVGNSEQVEMLVLPCFHTQMTDSIIQCGIDRQR